MADDFPCLDDEGDERTNVDIECKANAKLIAAAPDLLEMTIWAEAALSPFSKNPAERSGISKLRAAIAKATA